MKRREFLQLSTATLALSGYPVHGYTKDLPRGRIAVVVLEGGLDGLTAVPAIGDDDLVRRRRTLVASEPLRLNPFFALHPNLKNFAEMLLNDEAAIVHATAFPYTRRSHFEGQNLVETGLLEPFSSQTGWLGRAMELAGIAGRSFSLDTPLLVRGATSIDNFYPASLMGSQAGEVETVAALTEAFDPSVRDVFAELEIRSAKPITKVIRDPVGLALEAGKAMQTENGPRVAVIRIPEFDTHANQGADNGRHPELLSTIDKVFAGLKRGLGTVWSDTVVLTVTEFGRTVGVNGSAGTDHGYGSVGLLAGGLLRKSAVLANWPGLSDENLFEGRDLMATLDYRAVCSAAIEAALGLDHDVISEKVFGEHNLTRVHNAIFKV
jgi:uncharacterized protein (DUF1501 family)